MPYKIVYINEHDKRETIEAEEFDYGENGIVRIVTSSDDAVENVRYFPTHRLVLAEGAELWIAAKDDDEEEEEEEEEEEDLIEE